MIKIKPCHTSYIDDRNVDPDLLKVWKLLVLDCVSVSDSGQARPRLEWAEW